MMAMVGWLWAALAPQPNRHGDPDTMALTTIRSYVEALGGKLRLAADFGDHQMQFPAAV